VAQTVQTTDSAHPGQTQVSTHGATYDARDQQSGETADGVVTAYGYDAVGQRRTQSLLAGVITRTLDTAGRVTEIDENADGTGPYSSVYSNFDRATGQALTFQLGDGVAGLRAFDGANRPTGVSYYNVSGPNPNTALTYDGAGRVNSTTTLSGTDSLGYDGANRLTSETEQPGSTQIIAKGGAYHWTYDGNGNILTATDDTGATDLYTYSVSIPNELTAMGATGDPLTKTTAYSYDGSGNVTGIANTAPANDKNALVQRLSYDGQGRINQVTYLDHSNGNTTTTISIAYNAQGQRAEYAIAPQGQPTLDTRFTYRDGQLAQQQVISNTPNGPLPVYTNLYLYGPNGEPLELIHTQPGQPTGRYWYETDSQGSVITLTDSRGSVVDRYAYDSWGESTSDDRTNEHVPQQLRYKAQYYDEKLTWYWLGGRYYDPETERYLQPSAPNADDYTYAGDNPLGNGGAGAGSFGVGGGSAFPTGLAGPIAANPQDQGPQPDPLPFPVELAAGFEFEILPGVGIVARQGAITALRLETNPEFILTEVNAETLLDDYPPGATRVVVGRTFADSKNPDLRFYSGEGPQPGNEPMPQPLKEVEVKSLAGYRYFSQELDNAAAQVHYNGDVFVQVREGTTNAQEFINRFRTFTARRFQSLTAYSRVRVTIADPQGKVLYRGTLGP